MQLSHQYYVLVGNYGSGKTELSLALARRLRRECDGRVALVDLDIVNPYFRSAERKELLEKEGIEVKMPSFAMSTVDIPALPAEIQAVFEGGYERVVIDVGGDDTGAAALGMYAPQIAAVRDRLCALYVVNPYRPLSGSVQDICDMYELIGQRARLRPDGLVNNGNLQRETTAQELLAAQDILGEVSQRLSVPIVMVCGYEPLRAQLPQAMQDIFFPMEPLMLPEWLEDDNV